MLALPLLIAALPFALPGSWVLLASMASGSHRVPANMRKIARRRVRGKRGGSFGRFLGLAFQQVLTVQKSVQKMEGRDSCHFECRKM